MNDVPAAERGVAMVFQSYALFPHMTVFENMAFGLKLAKQPKDVIDRKVREAARILQLDSYLDRYPKALSGGQRQRVAIGRAIVREPGVFLFDEPLSNLDAALRGQTRVEIARLHQRFAQCERGLRDARSGRSHDARRQDRAAARRRGCRALRQHCADRRAARVVSPSEVALRGGFHRLAANEFHRCRGRVRSNRAA